MAQQHPGYTLDTPIFRPSKEEFSKPFCDYVNKVLKKHPDIPMFKVVPPPGWQPRKAPIRLAKLDISCPIKQHAYGTKGSYRCILVEQKKLTAEQFKEVAEDTNHAPPKKVRDGEDHLLERSFWSSVTINPPVYGADTPMSLFDEKLPYGWNLKHLDGCLLKRPDVPQEDADLFSINYLHFGAPKVWYCVSPSNRAKFERMCQSIFPELHKGCNAFMRHKDILLSPGLLRTYGIEYMQAKQEPNEFIVLNASAYHAGYNMGFNCAEAVNFAPPCWIDIGRNVVRCKCRDDGVRLSMRLFGCASGSSASSSEEYSSSDMDDSDSEGESDEQRQQHSSDDEASSEEVSSGSREGSDDEGEEEGGSRRQRGSMRQRKPSRKLAERDGGKGGAAGAAASQQQRSSKRAAAAAALHASPGGSSKRVRYDAVGPLTPQPPGPRQTRTARAAAEAAKRMRRTNATAEARAKLAVQRGRAGKGGHSSRPRPSRAKKSTADLEDSLQRAAAAAAAIRARQQQQAASQGGAAAEGDNSDQEQQEQWQQQDGSGPSAAAAAAVKREPPAAAAAVKAEPGLAAADAGAAAAADAVGPEEPDSPTATKARLSSHGKLKLEAPAAAAAAGDGEQQEQQQPEAAVRSRRSSQRHAAAAAAGCAADGPVGEAPKVILGEDKHGAKYFYMVQVLRDQKAKRRGHLVMRWLKEGKDGLFRPSDDTWEEPASCLLGVRTQWVGGRGGKAGGYRLLTLRSRILDTQLLG